MSERDEGYRAKCLRLYGEQCVHCGSTREVKAHHMDGDHDHDRKDNWVPLCQECHVALHRGAPPYTIWFALGQPVIRALDEYRDAHDLRSRSEAVARLLADADGLTSETWALLTSHIDRFYTKSTDEL